MDCRNKSAPFILIMILLGSKENWFNKKGWRGTFAFMSKRRIWGGKVKGNKCANITENKGKESGLVRKKQYLTQKKQMLEDPTPRDQLIKLSFP